MAGRQLQSLAQCSLVRDAKSTFAFCVLWQTAFGVHRFLLSVAKNDARLSEITQFILLPE